MGLSVDIPAGCAVIYSYKINNFKMCIRDRGSERVSEVAARFTLDAMPGKQMAIDADLNTGAITDEEAKIRRAEVQRESDFFGAMDGATKFVKGDAIISIITALINLIGGAVLGMMHGQDINSVLSTYSLATAVSYTHLAT